MLVAYIHVLFQARLAHTTLPPDLTCTFIHHHYSLENITPFAVVIGPNRVNNHDGILIHSQIRISLLVGWVAHVYQCRGHDMNLQPLDYQSDIGHTVLEGHQCMTRQRHTPN